MQLSCPIIESQLLENFSPQLLGDLMAGMPRHDALPVAEIYLEMPPALLKYGSMGCQPSLELALLHLAKGPCVYCARNLHECWTFDELPSLGF